MRLHAGDLVLIPHGRSHCILDEPERMHPPLEEVLAKAGYRGDGVVVANDRHDGAATELICGHYTFRDSATHPILKRLPDMIVVTAAARARFGWLDDIVRMLTRRVFEAGSPGMNQGLIACVQRLAEVMFVEILRAGINQSSELKAVMSAFADERIGKTLALIHANPEKPWTVEALAREAGMSRARYAEHFTQVIGEGPVGYLRSWRLQKAAELLDETRLPIQQIAARVGYESTAAFSRAFSQRFGASPSEFRPEAAQMLQIVS